MNATDTNEMQATATPPVSPAFLKGLLTLWIANSVNSDLYQKVQDNYNGERAAISARTGLAINQVNLLIDKAKTLNTVVVDKNLFDLTAATFQTLIAAPYPGGHACEELSEVLNALYPNG